MFLIDENKILRLMKDGQLDKRSIDTAIYVVI